MAEIQNPDTPASARWLEAQRAWAWVLGAWEHARRDLPLWLGMSAIYLVAATLLSFIPFAGFLLIVMLSPMILGSALLALHDGAGEPESNEPVVHWLLRPGRQLLRIFAVEAHAFAIVLLGIVTLGLVVMLLIAEHFLHVGSFQSVVSVIVLRTIPPWWMFISLLIALVLNGALLMGMFYATHRTVLAGRDPMIAVHESFNACADHAAALASLAGIFLLVGLVIAVGFHLSMIAGYLLLFTLGLVALPMLVIASYHSYREIFPLPSSP